MRSEWTTLTESWQRRLRRQRLAASWLLAAVGALGLTWVTTAHPLPVYDGINAPDEPYRYVAPAAGTKTTPPPTRATGSSPTTGGLNTAQILAASKETGPQVYVSVNKLALQGPATATSITVDVDPVAPDTQPGFGSIDGNVYRIAVSAGGQPVQFRADQDSGAIEMRATSDSQPGPVFVHRTAPADPWVTLVTHQVGNDIYEASIAGVGDYALAFKAADVPQTKPTSPSGISPAVYIVIGLLVVSVVVGAVLATRRRGAATP